MSKVQSRTGLLAVLALACVLLAGGALGYSLGRQPGPPRLKQMALIGVTRGELLDSLRLDPRERTRVDSVLDAAEERAREAIKRMMDDVQQVTREARDHIRAGLSSAQQTRFDSLLARAVPLRPRAPLPPRDTAR
jgi:hypothetical protein